MRCIAVMGASGANRYRRTLLIVGTMMVATGCAPTIKDLKTGRPFYHDWPVVGSKDSEVPPPYPNPVKIATTWSPDTLVQKGHTPTRGFGGRVYFYDEKSGAVPVEGTLVVHGFDDTETDADQGPGNVKRFEFTPQQFTRHFSQSDLGASYSVWIPWDAVGGPQRRISLVASFQTTSGKFVQGEPATILLPGANATPNVVDDPTMLSHQYQRHRRAIAAGQTSHGMTTTTIARGKTPWGKTSRGNQPFAPEMSVARTRPGGLQVRSASLRIPTRNAAGGR